MRKQAKEKPLSLVSDVTVRGAPEPTGKAVINLKPSYVKRHPYKVTGTIALIGAFAFLLSSYFSQASAVFFYPDSCLGNWEDVQKAQGKPDSSVPEEIGPHNAAILDRQAQEIYCGSFEGDVPDGVMLKTLNLKLSWVASDERLKAQKVIVPAEVSEGGESAETTSPAEQDALDNALDVQSQSSAEFDIVIEQSQEPATEVTPDPAPEQPQPEPEPTPEPQPEPTPEPEPTVEESPQPADNPAPAEPTSWLFLRRAVAQEVTPDPAPEQPQPEPEPTPEPQPEPTPEPGVENPGAEETADGSIEEVATSSVTSTEEVVVEDSGAFLTVEYSLDGQQWLHLKDVTRSNLAEPVPVPVTQWEEVEKIQIRIVRKATLDEVPYVYLDGMELIGEYDESPGMPTPDFQVDQPLTILSNDGYVLAHVLRHSDNRQVLWLFERTESPQWRIVATEDEMQRDTLLALFGTYVFWMSADGRAIVGYDVSSGTSFSKTVEPNVEEGLELPFADGKYAAVRVSGGIVIRDESSLEQLQSDNDADYSIGFWELARTGDLGKKLDPLAENATSTASTTTSTVEAMTDEEAEDVVTGEPEPEAPVQVPEDEVLPGVEDPVPVEPVL